MSVEVYVHARRSTQDDLRTGTLATGPARVTLRVGGGDPDEYPVVELGVGDSLMIEVFEQDAGAPEQPSATRPATPEPKPRARARRGK